MNGYSHGEEENTQCQKKLITSFHIQNGTCEQYRDLIKLIYHKLRLHLEQHRRQIARAHTRDPMYTLDDAKLDLSTSRYAIGINLRRILPITVELKQHCGECLAWISKNFDHFVPQDSIYSQFGIDKKQILQVLEEHICTETAPT